MDGIDISFDDVSDFLITFPESRLNLLKFLVFDEGPKTIIANWKQVVRNLDQKNIKTFLAKKLVTNTKTKGWRDSSGKPGQSWTFGLKIRRL